jgi:N6-adenosine-specific RNA methylase IME4
VTAPLEIGTLPAERDARQVYGALNEGVHIAGYTVERAFKNLEWLLDENRWQQLGVAFADVNAFVDSVKLDNLRIVVEQRKRIADRIRALQPQVSNRAIGRLLGVDHKTINNDARGENSPRTTSKRATSRLGVGENSPLSGAQVASLAEKAETKGEREIARLENRQRRLDEISATAAVWPEGRFAVFYADPPWRYDFSATVSREIENQYPTMSLDEICAEPVSDKATDDAILYLWATVPKLAEAFTVIDAWGFAYRSNFVWVKDKIGMGYHARNQHEHLLVATRGNIPPPAQNDRVASVINSARAEHSAKPTVFYDLIEGFYPTLPKIEVYARGTRLGWAVYGNQSS